jgi:competence protein ComEC
MPTMYVAHRTTALYKSSTDNKREMVLIYGDEVETNGAAVNNRIRAEFRGRQGFVVLTHLQDKPVLEMYFIDVGQGDSTFIVTPQRKKILIDGGINKRAYGFLAWKYNLDKGGPPIDIDLLVLSHADADHIDGLIPIISSPKINVRKVIHNGIATYGEGAFQTGLGSLDPAGEYLITKHDKLDELAGLPLSDGFEAWRRAISNEATLYNSVDSTTGAIDIGDPDVSISVLGPRLDQHDGPPVYRWFGSEAQTINGHSVVLKLDYDNVSAILSGDLNSKGAKNLLGDPSIISKLKAHIFKAPHHGSHDFHRPFLEGVEPYISIISSGDDPDHGHPRAIFIGAIGQSSRSIAPLVFSTEIAATFKEVGVKPVRTAVGHLEDLDTSSPNADSDAHVLFKKLLNGMINVRTDGEHLFAARRVKAGYWWESYGPLPT